MAPEREWKDFLVSVSRAPCFKSKYTRRILATGPDAEDLRTQRVNAKDGNSTADDVSS